jgi:hypothetical protein
MNSSCCRFTPCDCEYLGCFNHCDVVELPVVAIDNDPVFTRVSVGQAVAVKLHDYYAPGDRIAVDLGRVGQIGRLRIQVLGRCFELDSVTERFV